MKPITPIDFVARQGAPRTGLALLLLAAAALAWQGWLAWQDQLGLTQQREALSALNRSAAPQPGASGEQGQAQRHERAQLEQLALQLAAPWEDLLALFEQHGAGKVALVRLEPDASTGIVHVLARARRPRLMMDYVVALEGDARLSSVLLNHHEVLPDVPGAPLQFSVSAVWRTGAAQRARPGLREMAP